MLDFQNLKFKNAKLLVFPINMSECNDYIRICNSIGISVYGASSENATSNNKGLTEFIKLPYVTEKDFDEVLNQKLIQFNITHVYSPHQAVWWYLKEILERENSKRKFILCGSDPFSSIFEMHSLNEKWAKSIYNQSDLKKFPILQNATPHLKQSTYSILHQIFFNTPGQSDEDKLTALCHIFRVLPKGDVLEIGSLFGRSAFALGFLANKHKIGNLICIDPWGNMGDQGESAKLLNSNQGEINYNKVFKIFLNTMSMLDNVGYIRKFSQDAVSKYTDAVHKGVLKTPELGEIELTGKVCLLHIDGNHTYENVKNDVESWLRFLKPGGWLLLDDYHWAFGDGPQKIGDELLLTDKFDESFIMSDTLFLRRAI